MYLGFIRPKTGTMRFGPMAGLVGCAFYLILECTRFWPQTDQVYLFLAAALLFFSLGAHQKPMFPPSLSLCHLRASIPLALLVLPRRRGWFRGGGPPPRRGAGVCDQVSRQQAVLHPSCVPHDDRRAHAVRRIRRRLVRLLRQVSVRPELYECSYVASRVAVLR